MITWDDDETITYEVVRSPNDLTFQKRKRCIESKAYMVKMGMWDEWLKLVRLYERVDGEFDSLIGRVHGRFFGGRRRRKEEYEKIDEELELRLELAKNNGEKNSKLFFKG